MNRPVREGGQTAFINGWKARRADTACGAPSALSGFVAQKPALTDGSTHYRSFGAKNNSGLGADLHERARMPDNPN